MVATGFDRNAGNRPLAWPLFFAVLLHGLVALAWQPQPFQPPRETVLQAVLLPPVKAQAEAEQPEPPKPERRPEIKPQTSRATRMETVAELSDGMSESLVEPIPVAPPRALSGARSGQPVGYAIAAGAGLTEPESTSLGTVSGHTATLASRVGQASPLATSSSSGSELFAPVSSSAAAPPALSRRVALGHDMPRQAKASMAMPPSEGALTTGGTQTAKASPSAGPTSTLSQATSTERAVSIQQAAPSVASPAMAVARSAPGAALPTSLIRTTPAVESRTIVASSQSAALAHSADQVILLAASSDRPPTNLSRALPGRPVAVTGGGEGSNEFVDYADDNPEFVYPRLAARQGLEGSVVLEVEVLPDGRSGDIRLKRSSGSDVLDQDAIRQMATWRFKPALSYGRAHAARVTVPVHYRLESKGRP